MQNRPCDCAEPGNQPRTTGLGVCCPRLPVLSWEAWRDEAVPDLLCLPTLAERAAHAVWVASGFRSRRRTAMNRRNVLGALALLAAGLITLAGLRAPAADQPAPESGHVHRHFSK